MTIKKSRGEYVCECAECGFKHYGGTTEDFSDFVEELKEDGWSISKDGDEWVHVCADCMRS